MASGEEIQAALRAFVGRWKGYTGSERGEAQTFLNELFACYGGDRLALGAKFEDFNTSSGFMDLHWPGICIVEMKAPGRDLLGARAQVERYWKESADFDAGRKAARYVVLCSFLKFEIWQPGDYPSQPVASFDLESLPERYDALAFLAGPNVEPNFTEHHRELTREAAKAVAEVFHHLKDRSAAPVDVLQRFALQSVWCMFAEDLGLLDGYPFQSTLNAVRNEPERSAAELLMLFRVLNQKSSYNRKGRLAGTRYVNGELFAEPADVELDRDEIELLLRATAFDWTKVDPTIFGSLMEGVLGRDRRWELGAHYTHEVDIMKIVGPTVIQPWRARIESTSTPIEARALLDELCAFRVLDPACGCGNFLYVAYRELRGLEHLLKQRITALAHEQGAPLPPGPYPFFPLRNMLGIDIEQAAVRIARVVMWMGHRQMVDRYGEAEPALPLQDLSGIRVGDALRVQWPETDCIIGNPPFLGAKFIRPNFGDEYADWLIREFGVGVKDFCVYWFRRAHAHLREGQRAGLVGTNSISQTGGRSASLQHIVESGGLITDAVSTQKWPGDARVHVSLVSWIKEPTAEVRHTLDGRDVLGITSQLRAAGGATWEPRPVPANAGRCFAGVVPQGKGFLIGDQLASSLLNDGGVDYSQVVRRYLTGADLAAHPVQAPSRWIIDFGSMPLEEASRFPRALDHLRRTVREERLASKNRAVEGRWWLFGRRVEGMRAAIAPLDRCAVAAATGKRLTVAWTESTVCPMNTVVVFSVQDDVAMGLLLSRPHGAWAWARSSTFETRLRYTSAAVFDTFPWPFPVTDEQRDHVADVSRRLLARRSEICVREQIGLTKLYNAVDEGAWIDLKALHRELDVAVAACYGWPASIAQDDEELVRRLNDLNRQIVAEGRPYDPFATHG